MRTSRYVLPRFTKLTVLLAAAAVISWLVASQDLLMRRMRQDHSISRRHFTHSLPFERTAHVLSPLRPSSSVSEPRLGSRITPPTEDQTQPVHLSPPIPAPGLARDCVTPSPEGVAPTSLSHRRPLRKTSWGAVCPLKLPPSSRSRYGSTLYQRKYYRWFQGAANTSSVSMTPRPLHHLSGWHHLTAAQYDEMILAAVSHIELQSNAKIFEIGVGVGAALRVLAHNYCLQVVGGSDFAQNAVRYARLQFPSQSANFFNQVMWSGHYCIPDDYFDHVVSFGAVAMYASMQQMLTTMQDAVRITKPGGSLCFTHFAQQNSSMIGSILRPVDPEVWSEQVPLLGGRNVRVFVLPHQGDRYGFCFTKAATRSVESV